ncbi:MAG TPA: hypothetical protein DEB09_03555 [Candidatus Magasanikbacteria bacterium]|nr:hypothetical protein [Candidatus Magasanikbacteria bacterium]
MDYIFSIANLQDIVLVKLCFFVFVIFGIIGIYKKWKSLFFIILMSVTSALAYYFLVKDTALMLWGLKADEITIAAMYEMFAHGSCLSDFAYTSLPPFYPPLWFWLFGLLGRVINLNGVQIAKIASFSTILVYPAIFYLLQKWYWVKRKMEGENSLEPLIWFLGTIFLFVLISWDVTITKPYELVSASLVILWTIFLLNELKKGMNWKGWLVFGITGGILFMLFYFWFFLAAIGISLFNLFGNRVKLKDYGSLLIIGVFTLLFALPFWLPLAKSYSMFGTENWQLGFLTLDWLSTEVPLLQFNLVGLICLIGFVSLIIYRQRFYIRILLSLFVASYIWQIMGLVTIFFFASPLQESKGFYFFNHTILALSAAYGIAQLWIWLKNKYPNLAWQKSLALIGILVLATQLIFGVFVDNRDVLAVKTRSAMVRREAKEIIDFLGQNYSDINKLTILQSGIPELHAFLPFSDFIYFNQHNSHPAANFSSRFYYLKDLSLLKTENDFYGKIVDTPFGQVNLLILFKNGENYSLFFNLDNFPNEIREAVIDIPKKLFSEEYFVKKFENKDYVILEPKL